MRSIRRKIEIAAVLGALALLSSEVACREPLAGPMAAAHAGDATPRRGGTLQLATLSDARSIDPAGPTDATTRPMLEALFAGLVDYGDDGAVVPDLATRWEIADEGTTYRFFLREGVRFHDGDEVTADDLKRSAERALHPSTASANASYFEDLVGYDAYNAEKAEHLDGIVVEGRYVISYRITEPDSTFLERMALHALRPVCKSAGTRYSTSWQACGAGPFKLAPGGFQPGTGVHVVRHDGYFQPGLPYLDGIQWLLVMNSITQRLHFERGELDILREVTQGDVLRYLADDRWKAFSALEADDGVHGDALNTSVPPFDNVEMRRAVASAVDRERLRQIKPANITPATQLVPPATAGYEPSVRGQHTDLAEALEHMKRAGYPYDPKTGTGGYPRTLLYTAYAGFTEYSSQLLAQQLAQIGIRLEIRVVSTAVWFNAIQHDKHPDHIIGTSWGKDYLDPGAFFGLFTSDSTTADFSQSGSFYKNPQYDDLVKRARHELDSGKRKTLLDEANQILCDDAPWAFSYFFHFYILHQPYVLGYREHPMWNLNVRFAWLDRDGTTAVASREKRSGAVKVLASLFGAGGSAP